VLAEIGARSPHNRDTAQACGSSVTVKVSFDVGVPPPKTEWGKERRIDSLYTVDSDHHRCQRGFMNMTSMFPRDLGAVLTVPVGFADPIRRIDSLRRMA
jgi:hypothetical protein